MVLSQAELWQRTDSLELWLWHLDMLVRIEDRKLAALREYKCHSAWYTGVQRSTGADIKPTRAHEALGQFIEEADYTLKTLQRAVPVDSEKGEKLARLATLYEEM